MNYFFIATRTLQALTIFACLYVIFIPALTVIMAIFGIPKMDMGLVTIRTGTSTLLWHAILSLIPNAIVASGLLYLTKFASLLANGSRFTNAVSNCLGHASVLFVIGVLMSWIVEPLITTRSYAAAFQELLQNHGLLLIISIAFTLVAKLLRDAKAIEDENKEFY